MAAAHVGRDDAIVQSPPSTVVQSIHRKQADIGRQHAATATVAATESDDNFIGPKNHRKLIVSMAPCKTGTTAFCFKCFSFKIKL